MGGIKTTTRQIIPSPENTGADLPKESNPALDSEVSKPAINEIESEIKRETEQKVNEYIEGAVQLLPNCNFKCREVYAFKGLGKIFDGSYYFSKVTHTITDTYSVQAEVTQVQKAIDNTSNNTRVASVDMTPPKVPEEPKYQVITIKWGDTLWALSRKYGTTVEELARINNIKNPDLIYAGDTLKVPAK